MHYQYGAPDIPEAVPEAVKSSTLSARVEEYRGESTLPAYHIPVKPAQAGTQLPVPSFLSTPTKDYSSRVEAYHRENTPLTLPTLPSLGCDSSDSYVFQPPRYIGLQDADEFPLNDSYGIPPPARYIDTQDADQVRVSINFQNPRYSSPLPDTSAPATSKMEAVLQTFGPKLVLEVMGGAGAVWGFSEALGLRTSHSVWFWRPVTFFAGGFFFNRWLGQLQKFRREYDRRVKEGSTMEDETVALLLQESA